MIAAALPMLDATEPPSCLAGGVTTRADVAPVHYVDEPSDGDPTTSDWNRVTCSTCLQRRQPLAAEVP